MDERKILYQQFLENKNLYNLNISFWRVKLQAILEEKISVNDLLIKNKTDKGKNFYDGNPIFSFYNNKVQKAIRIIQEDPTELKNYSQIKLLEAWISKILIVDSNLIDKEIQELVISLYLTKSTVDKCMFLVKEWFSGDLTQDNIENKVNSLN